MSKLKLGRDPRGHHIRIYDDIYDSPAFAALSPHDVLAYLALLRELKGTNNGNLSLPLTRSTKCGIKHSKTLARSLRALCAVGLVAITRKGGCKRGGQRQPTLYRVTDHEGFENSKLMLEATRATNEWKRITSVEQALQLIEAAELAAKKGHAEKNNLGHAVPSTASRGAPVRPKTRVPRDSWNGGLGHGVTMAEKTANPIPMRVADEFLSKPEIASHRAPRMPPIYIATPTGNLSGTDDHRTYGRLTAKPAQIFTNLIH
jgi:hypothetical protein